MKSRSSILIILHLCTSLALTGTAGFFSDQATATPALTRNRLTVSAQNAPTKLRLSVIDFQQDFNSPNHFPVREERRLRVVGTPGDCYTSALAIQLPQALPKEITPELSSLTGTGGTIPREQLLLLEAIPANQNPKNPGKASYLLSPDWQNIKPGETFAMLLYIDIPATTRPGNYDGTLTIAGEAITIHLTVLPFTLPKLEDSFGFHLPGHFDRGKDDGKYWNSVLPGWNRDNSVGYFRFMNARRVNSASFYHIYPRFTNNQADFSEITDMIRIMRSAGCTGIVELDLRHIIWYCNTLAYNRQSGQPAPRGGEEGTIVLNHTPKAIACFETILKQLLDTAAREPYRPLLLFTDEEVVNSPEKLAAYEQLLPSLKKYSSNETLLIYNGIGYNRPGEIDLGHRDAVPFRQYNSWTEQALADAARDGAVIGSFNYDFHRMSTGFLQLRLGSSLHHQWADQWGGQGERGWHYTYLTSDGVVSSWQVERLHAGRIDLAAIRMLQSEVEKLPEQAESIKRLLQELTSDIPVSGPRYIDWQHSISSRELDLRRAKIFQAISRARTPGVTFAAAPGTPSLTISETSSQESNQQEMTLRLKRSATPIQMDAKRIERTYTGTGPIRYVVNQENAIRAKCSTAEEFQQHRPSYSQGFVTYDSKGLFFAAESNHWSTAPGYRHTHRSDDPEIWQDDNIQFFWYEPQQQARYQLLINLKGEKTLLRNGAPVSTAAIRTTTLNRKGGGIDFEAFVPWTAMGRMTEPPAGTIWDFNFAREFHTYNQFTSFGRVQQAFADRKNWGALFFSGEPESQVVKHLNLPPLYPGQNRIGGLALSNVPQPLTGKILNQAGKTLATCEVEADKAFTLDFSVSNRNALTLQFESNGKVLERISCPVESTLHSLTIQDAEPYTFTGDRLKFRWQPHIAALSSAQLTGELKQNQTEIPLPPLTVTGNQPRTATLNTAGLTPGAWELVLKLDGVSAPPIRFEVLPDFHNR